MHHLAASSLVPIVRTSWAASGVCVGCVRAGETAVACAQLELHALFQLCVHAAKLPAHHVLVKATLRSVAARMGYPTLPAYIHYHMVPLVFLW